MFSTVMAVNLFSDLCMKMCDIINMDMPELEKTHVGIAFEPDHY